MDQPINLPSQFISLRCRGVEIQISLLGAPKSCETSNPISRQYFPAFAASPKLSPMILSIDPCRINDQIQIKANN
ncbi:uncharacterized protein TRIVIDRAFT_186679 [Trichoderma virens Gv29-8]|uniref:Uncharacterized protein n=1 Tax=Hypocrea virens (strain Gv29-8 / FGSC 10586) TaxID=413071 RepID=G9MX75_HYPVG|nr:uncharacterized protein TRIVIDRAFT_186679 [Trichoderma virens Gv29-8]EHK21007.1 hypothetical protein TRIVIDRAFT_186679 [Trichoderma virens Gv29-8]